MRLSPRLSLFLTLAWTLVLFGGWALLSEMTSEAAPLTYDPDLEFKVLAHIPVGEDPRGIAVVTQTNTIYVANHDDHSISVIDGDTLTVTQVISAGLEPCAIAYNPNNGYLYVTNRKASGTVTVISTTTNMTVTTINLQGKDNPTGIAYNPHDGCMYVAMNYAPGSVLVISDTSVIDTVTDTLSSFNWPAHIAVKEASKLLYVTNGGGTVSVINGPTRTVTEEINLNLDDPWGIAVNQSTGWVYVATVTGGELARIQPNDTVTDSIKPDPAASLCMVAVDPIQTLVFATQDDEQTVLVYDPETSSWIDELKITVQQDPERGIAFDPVKHRLYVSNRISDTVTVIQEIICKLYFPIIMKSFS